MKVQGVSPTGAPQRRDALQDTALNHSVSKDNATQSPLRQGTCGPRFTVSRDVSRALNL